MSKSVAYSFGGCPFQGRRSEDLGEDHFQNVRIAPVSFCVERKRLINTNTMSQHLLQCIISPLDSNFQC